MKKLERFLMTVFSVGILYAVYLAANVMGAVDKAAAAPIAQAEVSIDAWLGTYGPFIFGAVALIIGLWLIWFVVTVIRMKNK